VLSFVGLVVLVLVVNGGLETWFMYRRDDPAGRQVGGRESRAIARRVEQFIAETERQISWATRASTTTIGAAPRRLRAVDAAGAGRSIGPSIWTVRGGSRSASRAANSSPAPTSIIPATRASRSCRGLGLVVSVYFNGREPFMAIAVAHSGRAAGSTVAEVSLKVLSDFLERGQIGSETEAYIVDRSGRLLAHSEPRQELGTNYASLPQVAAASATRRRPRCSAPIRTASRC
jgi:adenylate cyclase